MEKIVLELYDKEEKDIIQFLNELREEMANRGLTQ